MNAPEVITDIHGVPPPATRGRSTPPAERPSVGPALTSGKAKTDGLKKRTKMRKK
jgi:hypothetical protein